MTKHGPGLVARMEMNEWIFKEAEEEETKFGGSLDIRREMSQNTTGICCFCGHPGDNDFNSFQTRFIPEYENRAASCALHTSSPTKPDIRT
ncbi:unnamed protein product [Caretta caretta]